MLKENLFFLFAKEVLMVIGTLIIVWLISSYFTTKVICAESANGLPVAAAYEFKGCRNECGYATPQRLEWSIRPIFRSCGPFLTNNVAIVEKDVSLFIFSDDNYQKRFIRPDGTEAFEDLYPDNVYSTFESGVMPVSNSPSNVRRGIVGDRKFGYIDEEGVFVIKPQFESAENFSEGLAAIELNGKWGYINKAGDIVIEPRYYYAHSFDGGSATVAKNDRDDKYCIDKQGRTISSGRCN